MAAKTASHVSCGPESSARRRDKQCNEVCRYEETHKGAMLETADTCNRSEPGENTCTRKGKKA